jgi:hypothetical protein
MRLSQGVDGEQELQHLGPYVGFESKIQCDRSFAAEDEQLNLHDAIHELKFQNSLVQ